MKIELSEKTIENIINYTKEHPKEVKGFIQFLGDEVFDIIMSPKVLKKGADLYRAINREINYSYTKEDKKYV